MKNIKTISITKEEENTKDRGEDRKKWGRNAERNNFNAERTDGTETNTWQIH